METQQPTVRRKVLIVNDVKTALMLSMCLNAYGHDMVVAYGGVQGVALAQVFEPEVIFLALGMPQMDGYQVAAALRQIPQLSRVLIAALTGWNDKTPPEGVASSGFDEHLANPAKVEVVLDVIEHVPVSHQRRPAVRGLPAIS